MTTTNINNISTDAGITPISSQLVLVEHTVQIWTGQAALITDDFNTEVGKDIVKEDVRATSGQKWLIGREKIASFKACKTRILATLQARGIRFMGGYAVPAKEWANIRVELDEAVAKFELYKTQFLANYDHYISEWASAHPLMEKSILRSAPSRDVIMRRLNAGYMAVRLQPVTAEEAPAFEKKIRGLSGQLVREIGQSAKNFIATVMSRSGDKLSSVKQISQIAKKLSGLAFIAPGCLPFATLIEGELRSVQKEGEFDRENPLNYQKILAIVSILTNEELLAEIIEGRMSMTEVSSKLKAIVSSSGVTAPEQTQLSVFDVPEPESEPVSVSVPPVKSEASANELATEEPKLDLEQKISAQEPTSSETIDPACAASLFDAPAEENDVPESANATVLHEAPAMATATADGDMDEYEAFCAMMDGDADAVAPETSDASEALESPKASSATLPVKEENIEKATAVEEIKEAEESQEPQKPEQVETNDSESVSAKNEDYVPGKTISEPKFEAWSGSMTWF